MNTEERDLRNCFHWERFFFLIVLFHETIWFFVEVEADILFNVVKVSIVVLLWIIELSQKAVSSLKLVYKDMKTIT